MAKAMAFSVVVVCLVVSSSFAGVRQSQSMDIGLANSAALTGGNNARTLTEQGGLIVNIQGGTNTHETTALQGQGMVIGQTGRLNETCGGATLDQTINGGGLPVGNQEQNIGDCCDRATESQQMGFVANAKLGRTVCADGTVASEQKLGAAQAQYATNSSGMQMGEGSLLIGGQSSRIVDGIGTVDATIVADIQQSQTITN